MPGFSVGRFLRAVVGCSGYGWADNSVGVGVCCVRRFLRTVGGPVAWPVLGTVGGCCGAFSVCCCGLFRLRLGPLVCVVICGRVFGGCLGVVVLACSVFRLWVYPVCYEVDNSPLFNFNRIFSPFLGARAETLRRNLLFEGTMLMR